MEEYGSVFGQRFGTICQTKFNVESGSVVSELHSLGLSNISASCLTKLSRDTGSTGLALGTATREVHVFT